MGAETGLTCAGGFRLKASYLEGRGTSSKVKPRRAQRRGAVVRGFGCCIEDLQKKRC